MLLSLSLHPLTQYSLLRGHAIRGGFTVNLGLFFLHLRVSVSPRWNGIREQPGQPIEYRGHTYNLRTASIGVMNTTMTTLSLAMLKTVNRHYLDITRALHRRTCHHNSSLSLLEVNISAVVVATAPSVAPANIPEIVCIGLEEACACLLCGIHA